MSFREEAVDGLGSMARSPNASASSVGKVRKQQRNNPEATIDLDELSEERLLDSLISSKLYGSGRLALSYLICDIE